MELQPRTLLQIAKGAGTFLSAMAGIMFLFASPLLIVSLVWLAAYGPGAWWPWGLLTGLAGLPGVVMFGAFLYEDRA